MGSKTVVKPTAKSRVAVLDLAFRNEPALWPDFSYRPVGYIPVGYIQDLFERDRLQRS